MNEMAARSSLDRLFRPRSIAIVGAHPDGRTMGGTILANLDRFAFTGPIHLVSQTRREINGRPCVAAIDALPEGVDAMVLNLPRAAIMAAVDACIARGVGGVVMFAAGFAEDGEEGRIVQEAIAAKCRAAGMALLGPNCLGYVNYQAGVGLTFEPVAPRARGTGRQVAVLAQSGATASAIRAAMQSRGIDVAFMAATGNEAVVRSEDLIDFLLDEGAVSAIALYAEQIRDPRRFLEVARKARAARVPIVLLHPGSSARGRAAAASHTGSLVGDYAVMRTALLNQAVVVVATMDELYDAMALLHRFPTPAVGDLAIVTNSGAIRGMAFDFCDAIGATLAPLSDATKARLKGFLADGLEADNPLDVGTSGFVDGSVFGRSTAAFRDDPAIGGILVAVTGGGPAQQRAKADAIVPEVTGSEKPIALAVIGDESPLDPDFLATIRDHHIPLFRSPERALRAFRLVQHYARAIAPADQPPPLSGIAPIAGDGSLPEYAGKAFLASLGVRVPTSELATSADDGAAAAARVGYPVVLKVQAAMIGHKSDIGGVIVGIADEAQLRAGWARISEAVARAHPTVTIDGILVEKMAPKGLEMVVGAKADPDWGSTLLVGLGGVWIEALQAVELLPADLPRAAVIERIRGMRGAVLLDRFRGEPPRDVAALADLVVTIGAAIRAGLGIREIEINPVLVGAECEGVTALDALIVLDDSNCSKKDRSS